MGRPYMETLMGVQPLIKYLEEKYLGKFKIFNLVFVVTHDSKKERDQFIEDLCTIPEFGKLQWHNCYELTDVVYLK